MGFVENVNKLAVNIDPLNDNLDKIVIVADNITDVTNFSDVYLGPKDTAPTKRNDGTDLRDGDLYFDTTNKTMMVYSVDDVSWSPINVVSSTISNFEFEGDGATTEFTIDGGYTIGMIEVYLNGSNVTPDDSVDVSDGEKVKFDTAPDEGDIIYCVVYKAFEIADVYTKAEADDIVKNIYRFNFEEDVATNDDNDGDEIPQRRIVYTDTSDNLYTLKLSNNEVKNGNQYIFVDSKGAWDTNNLIIDGNGNTIEGDDTLVCDVKNGSVRLVFDSIANEWRII